MNELATTITASSAPPKPQRSPRKSKRDKRLESVPVHVQVPRWLVEELRELCPGHGELSREIRDFSGNMSRRCRVSGGICSPQTKTVHGPML